ncbi:MAG: CheR methyltransferase, SAM binding domain [Betaproteobacteria bacterium ADurb.Bin341]|nr:MAG: CheR methyltransferase, SAM binding domain [Betaproteobacteria bacterium ADurb.Bin341]
MIKHHSSAFRTCAMDELEHMALEELAKRRCFNPQASALVIPGRCDLTIELARKSILVSASDEGDWDEINEQIVKKSEIKAKLRENALFLPIDLKDSNQKITGEPFDVIICRSGLSSVSYGDARTVVRQLMRRLKIGGRLYLSLLGLHSELGSHYPGAESMVTSRFCELAPKIQEKYHIMGPVCLYSERDLLTLILESGFSPLRTFSTTHGNVKGIAVRV